MGEVAIDGISGIGGTGGSGLVGGGGGGESADVEATDAVKVEAAGRGLAFGVLSWLLDASFSCSDLTLRVSDSTFEASFFFSLISLRIG